MKKLLGIVVLGLLLSGNVYAAETEKSIRDKYKSELPDCDNGIIADLGDSKKWTEWNNCFGRVKMDTGDGSFVVAADHRDDNTGVELWIMGPDIANYAGTTFFKILTKNGCKKNGHAISSDGKLYKAKWNKRCDNITKLAQIK